MGTEMRKKRGYSGLVLIAALVLVVVLLAGGCRSETETTATTAVAATDTTATTAASAVAKDATATTAATDTTTSVTPAPQDGHPAADVAAGPLSQEEQEALIYLREEEKLAHDVYVTLYEKWGTRVFDNISASETKHMASMKSLLDNYGLADPVGDNGIGVFAEPELQQLFDALISQGNASEAEALKVGVAIETKDIEDLERLIALTTHSDIKDVAANLLDGSKNHLVAFSKR